MGGCVCVCVVSVDLWRLHAQHACTACMHFICKEHGVEQVLAADYASTMCDTRRERQRSGTVKNNNKNDTNKTTNNPTMCVAM